MSDVLNKQVGGDHYKNLPIQPTYYCWKNNLGGLETAIVQYVSRWRNKNGIEDLEKAKHTLEMLIEFERKEGLVK